MEIHPSARRHGVDDEAIRHGVEHPLVVVDLDPDGDPPKILAVGPDLAENMLEVIVLVPEDDRLLATHAMPLRKKYFRLLPEDGL